VEGDVKGENRKVEGRGWDVTVDDDAVSK